MNLKSQTFQAPKPGREIEPLIEEIEKVFAGKREVVELALTAFLAGGHLLLEDVPGVGKTTLAKAISRAVECSFSRIQFTSDMLPSDVTGTYVFNPAKGEFHFRSGPVFSNIVLADEINRSSPRTQSALLEAMNERQVTVDNETFPLAAPFFVIATQNPKELHGTYPLPESQLDRFLLSASVGYPDEQTEKEIISGLNDQNRLGSVRQVLGRDQARALQERVEAVEAKDELVDYVYRIIHMTREAPQFMLGASPRAGIQLLKAARAYAVLRGRDYIIPDDIRFVAPNVLAHRLALKNAGQLFAGRSQALSVIEELLDSTPAP